MAEGPFSPSGSDLFSQRVAPSVSWALGRFTAVFGMGTGGATPLKPPESFFDLVVYYDAMLKFEVGRCSSFFDLAVYYLTIPKFEVNYL